MQTGIGSRPDTQSPTTEQKWNSFQTSYNDTPFRAQGPGSLFIHPKEINSQKYINEMLGRTFETWEGTSKEAKELVKALQRMVDG